MNILLIHPNEVAGYHLERLVRDCLQKLGHHVETLRYRGVDSTRLCGDIARLSSHCDFTLVLKGESLLEEHYKAIRSFSGLWYVDHPKDGVLPHWLVLGCSSVDIVFASSFGLLETLRELNGRVRWLVEGAHLDLLNPRAPEPRYDIAFFGTLIAETGNGDVMGERWRFLSEVERQHELHVFGADSERIFEDASGTYQFGNAHPEVYTDDLAREIARTRIVLGYNSTNQVPLYWSNRTYVTLALRGFLLTPYVPGLEQVFRNHEELAWFHSIEELHELIEYYLRYPEQRRQIAERGYRKVLECFSTESRVAALVDAVHESLPISGRKQSVLFVTDARYPGCAAAASQWRALLRSEAIRVDHVLIEQPVSGSIAAGYDTVVLNGHSGLYEPLLDEFNGAKWFAWYSSILQTDLENENGAVRRIIEAEHQGRVKGVICSDESTRVFFRNSVYIPLVTVFSTARSNRDFRIPGKVNISLLGPAKPRKNYFTALAALGFLSDDYVVHTNLPQSYYKEHVAGLFNEDRILNHGWLAGDDYRALIHDCDFGVQLSAAESYDYVVADHVLLERPVICSANIPAAPHPDLVIRNLENPGELIAAIDRVRRADAEQRHAWFECFHKENNLRCREAVRRFKARVVGAEATVRAPAVVSSRPRLSIVYHGRNDNYGGDFSRRLAWSIATVRRAFGALSPEWIFVNWNTVPGSSSLFDEPVLAEVRDGFKVYMVPASVHRELAAKHGYDGVYLEWYAKNFGLRRATGEYILQLNSDNLLLDRFDERVLPAVNETLIGARTEVDAEVLNRRSASLTHESIAHFKGRVIAPLIDRPYFVGGSCGEFVLTHRDNWYAICGNVETADRWCIDNVTATHLRRVTELTEFPYPVYHVSHTRVDGSWPGFDFEFGYSGEKWGLADYRIEPVVYSHSP